MESALIYDFHKNYNIKNPKKFYLDKGLSGLVNIGNKCYMNSIIQCLSNTLKLTDYFLSVDCKDDIVKTASAEHFVLNSYMNTLKAIWSDNDLIKPKSFIENIAKIHRKYYSINHQDSHEFLLLLLDILHKTIKYSVDIKINESKSNNKLIRESVDAWNHYFENDYSFIIELFYGSRIDIKECINCDFKNNVFDPFNEISLNMCIGDSDKIEDILEMNFKQELNNDWICEKCNKKGCNKKTELWSLPNHLIVHLKRYDANDKKIDKLVNFPLKNLNMTPYLCKSKEVTDNYIYDCYAINYHIGDTSSGHYYSACKNLNEKWYCMDDGNVSMYDSSEKILNSQLVNKDAYILFYVRKFLKKTSIQV
jgi:ubiquitin carboxyl-terminal hydrolase 8